jgi:hypothetical protein
MTSAKLPADRPDFRFDPRRARVKRRAVYLSLFGVITGGASLLLLIKADTLAWAAEIDEALETPRGKLHAWLATRGGVAHNPSMTDHPPTTSNDSRA